MKIDYSRISFRGAESLRTGETLKQLRDGGKSEPVLQGLWGKGLEELDDAWHKWVLKTY